MDEGAASKARGGRRRCVVGAVGVLSAAGTLFGGVGVARAAPDAVYVVQTQGAPVEVGVSIPLRVGVKIGGTEAAVDDTPSARGAAMLVDSRPTGLVGLLLFGTTANPPVKLPTPTVAEAFWANGGTAQQADATFVTDPTGQRNDDGPLDPRLFSSVAKAEPGPRSTGQASYAGFGMPGLHVAVSGMASESVADAKGDAAVATTRSVVKRLSLLDGQVTVDDIVATATGAADGTAGGLRATSTFTVGRVTAFGTPVELTTEGLSGAGAALDQLAKQGLSIRLGSKQEDLDQAKSHVAAVSRGVAVRFQPPGAQQAIDFTVGFAGVDISAPPRPVFKDNPAVAVPEEPQGTGGGLSGGSGAVAPPRAPSVSPESLTGPAGPALSIGQPPSWLAPPASAPATPPSASAAAGVLAGPTRYRPSSAATRGRPADAARAMESLAQALAFMGLGAAVVFRGWQYAVRVSAPR